MKLQLDVLQEPAYRSLFAARALSLLGDGVVPVALAFAVLRIGGTATSLGVVLAAQSVPRVALILVGGVMGDRLSRRNVMLATDLIRFVSQGAIAVLLITHHAEIWHLAALTFVYGAAAAFFMPASTGLIPQVVPGERLQEANALLSMTMSAFSLFGPLLAGVLVATVGPGWAFAVDSASFLASASFLLRIRTLGAVDLPDASSFLNQLREGWGEVRSRSWLLMDGVFSALGNATIIAPIFVLGPVIASRSLGGAKAWAVIAAAFGLGAIAGSVTALRFKPSRPLVVGWAVLALFALPAALLAVAAPTWSIAAGALAAGFSLNLANTFFETALQQHVPPHAISRAMSFALLLALVLHPIGLTLVGPLADVVGIRTLLLASAGWAVAASCIVLAVPGVRDLRRLPAPSD